MGLASHFASFLRAEQRMHPVWPPLASAVSLGDYGALDDGVFVRLGHISEFGIRVPALPSSPIDSFRVKSNGIVITRLQGGVEVPSFQPAAEIDASIQLACQREYSFWVQAADVVAVEMASSNEVARGLSRALGWKDGPFGWLVVKKVYSSTRLMLLATKEAETTIELRGDAKMLLDFEAQIGANLDVAVQANKSMAIELRGKAGPVGLELFRVAWRSGKAVNKRGMAEESPASDSLVLPEDSWLQALPAGWS
jgi:hypothetical protein